MRENSGHTASEREAEEEREKEREITIDRPRCATFADLISAHHARVAADVRCHLAGNCYRFKLWTVLQIRLLVRARVLSLGQQGRSISDTSDAITSKTLK